MSSLNRKIKLAIDSVTSTTSSIIKSKELLASETVIQERSRTCRVCEYYVKSSIGVFLCSRCGCVQAFKIRLAGSKCPLDRWKR